ncbi:MAG: hypothetical protein H6Q54_1460 [Deltaproteobacteria bacterium]|nr:hypothetical protein [Deltaproteobacteria bacterium]
MLKSYKDLDVWKKAYQFCLKIYKITKSFPEEERYGLASQMRRASVSITCNIAEGYGRKTKKNIYNSFTLLMDQRASWKHRPCL